MDKTKADQFEKYLKQAQALPSETKDLFSPHYPSNRV